jgi:deferrochelatase/peroxidase EfeB
MSSNLQEGIYYRKNQFPNHSYCIIFLRKKNNANLSEVDKTLRELWKMFQNLKIGKMDGISISPKNRYDGKLTVLIGYGKKIFKEENIKKSVPVELDNFSFKLPSSHGGGPILEETNLRYANDVKHNELLDDHIIIQLIGNTQLSTHRALVETWRLLNKIRKNLKSDALYVRTFFSGFSRLDKRSWLGFHDGVSNIKSTERSKYILIDKSNVIKDDSWLINGTYLALLRIAIDLELWENMEIKYQERIIGRDKNSGCPIVGVDSKDKNIVMSGCPIVGTTEINEKGNERFRNYPIYGNNYPKSMLYSKQVIQSHSRTMHNVANPDKFGRIRNYIFRQGFEFLEPINTPPYFRTGLNFVSFQRSVIPLLKLLKEGMGKASLDLNTEQPFPGLDKFLSVYAAGLFVVPPEKKGELFPGQSIFS